MASLRIASPSHLASELLSSPCITFSSVLNMQSGFCLPGWALTQRDKNELETKRKTAKEFRGARVEERPRKQDLPEPGSALQTMPGSGHSQPEGLLFRCVRIPEESSSPEVVSSRTEG